MINATKKIVKNEFYIMIVVTFTPKFHSLNTITIIEQKQK